MRILLKTCLILVALVSQPALYGADDEQEAVWAAAERSGGKRELLLYLNRFPEGLHVTAAQEKLAAILRLEAEQRAANAFRDCPHCPEMVALPAGLFVMGASDLDNFERPVHEVRLAAFSIARTEVTQAQWRAVMKKNPSYFKDCDECPVENVSWNDIQEYLEALKAETGKSYRLPSEAEWEYACRAGGAQAYCGGNSFLGVAWTEQNSGGRTRLVGQRRPNAFGLHDMSGNVWEWVADCWNVSYAGAPTDGRPWLKGECGQRMLRGGSWDNGPEFARSAKRNWDGVGRRYFNFGFRVALNGGKPN